MEPTSHRRQNALPDMRTLALCAGYGGLELGLEMAGWAPHLVAYAEIEPAASAVMAHHWPDAPNLGDLTTIGQVPQVDAVTAGFPCQPVSAAGTREGVDDERWIIRDVVDVWVRSGAHRLFLENVPGLLSANDGEAFGQVIDALAEVGSSAEWACLRASDVGACHRRERWFCIATRHTDSVRRSTPVPLREPQFAPERHPTAGHTESVRRDETPSQNPGRRAQPPGPARGTDRSAADTDGNAIRSQPVGVRRGEGEAEFGQHRQTVANPDSVRLGVQRGGLRPDERDVDHGERFGGYAQAVERWAHIIGRPPPEPVRNQRLDPRFVEWMMGLNDGWVTGVNLDHLDLTAAQHNGAQLQVLGNGVMPLQSATAYRHIDQAAA